MHQETETDLSFPVLYLQNPGPGILVQLDFVSPEMGSLAFFGGDCAGIFTGATYGVTSIVVDTLDGEPDGTDINEWETVEEATIDVAPRLSLYPHPASTVQSLEALAATAIPMPHLESGLYTLRVSSRGRDINRSDVAIRLQFWPAILRSGLRVIANGDDFDPRSLTSVTPRHHDRRSAFSPPTDASHVPVSHHTFLISGLDTDPTDTYTGGTVFDAGNNLVSVKTGIASGPVEVVVERFDGDPLLETGIPSLDLSAWESVDEVTVPCRTDMWFITLDGEVLEKLGSFEKSPSGTRSFRIGVRGRASKWDMIVDEPVENYIIQTWPSPGGPSMITPVKWTDGMWERE